MPRWTAYPYDASAYVCDAAALRQKWSALHACDAEPLPTNDTVLEAWALFHAGRFEEATRAGLKAVAGGAPAGLNVANKAQAVYAWHLERSERSRQALYLEIAERARQRCREDPHDASAWYWLAYALGRYGQSLSVITALSLGLGTQVKHALETTIELSQRHADAHIALGSFHAEVIDKVGALLGRTQGASRDAGLAFFKAGLKLNPRSAFGLLAYANGLMMLEGDKRLDEATRLYEAAAAIEPLDAAERLDVERAKTELED